METITFMTSLLTFYLKGEVKAEQNFLMLKKPHTLLTFIPCGAERHNLPINQISSVSTSFRVLLKDTVVGLILAIVGFCMFGTSVPLALLLVIIGAMGVINSLQTALIISTTSGDDYVLFFLIFEKNKALIAEAAINRMISTRLDDTNVRTQTENQTAALTNAQAQSTEAIINAINTNNRNQ